MDRDAFWAFLMEDIKRILPHLEMSLLDDLISFLQSKGCKKERDLRIMTIPLLETHLDLVDSTDLYTEWQNRYGPAQPLTFSDSHRPEASQSSDSHRAEAPQASTSSAGSQPVASTSRRVLTNRQLNEQLAIVNSKMPTFDKDSPFMPAGVRAAILSEKRPLPREREDMVQRIVDHCRATVPNLERLDFHDVADALVKMYPASFKDTLPVSEKGSESLREQLKSKFDNDRRPVRLSAMEVNCPNNPAAYGCTSWNPPIPDGESEESLLLKKQSLQDMYQLTKKQWDWKIIKSHMEATFSLQRRDINGPVETQKPASKKRKRTDQEQEQEQEADQPSRLTVLNLKQAWPFLFKPRGLNYHFIQLTGIDFREKLGSFIRLEGKVLIEFLACKKEDLAKVRRRMTRAETRALKSTTTAALLQMLPLYFGEQLSNMITFVEETSSVDEAGQQGQYPEDGTPSLIVAGKNLFDAQQFFVTIDQTIVTSTLNLEDAFTILFGSYFVLNIQFSSKLERTLTFVQRSIAKINPEKGSKGKSTGAARKSLNKKVVNLSNTFEEYKQKLADEEEEGDNRN